jgi:hypothetical protein
MSYRSLQGKMVDMDKLMRQNELVPAVGNAKVNARGDQLGPGGRIIKKREEIVAEYYQNNPKAKPRVQADAPAEPVATPSIATPPVAVAPVNKFKKSPTEE